MPDKAPAFQFYPKDFLTDEKVVRMSNTEVGIYIRLLSYCWLEGTLPLETAALAHMARMQVKQFTKLWENSTVKTCFHIGDDGRLHHKRLDGEREKQESYRRRQSDKGKASAAARGSTAVQPNGNHGSTTVQPPVQPEGNSSSPSPISSLQTAVTSARVVSDDELGDRARELLEHYGEWYREERHGARLRLIQNALTFQDALTLVETWDDARLEKLARLVLTTDDPFISGTDRGFKIFALKASWADNLLRAWELKNACTA